MARFVVEHVYESVEVARVDSSVYEITASGYRRIYDIVDCATQKTVKATASRAFAVQLCSELNSCYGSGT